MIYELPFVAIVAFISRFVTISFLIPSTLLARIESRPELGNPFVSLKFLKEVRWMLSKGVPVYENLNCLPMPISVYLWSSWKAMFGGNSYGWIGENIYFSLLDTLIAYYLWRIISGTTYTASNKTLRSSAPKNRKGLFVALFYLLNPFVFASFICKSSSPLPGLLSLASICHGIAGGYWISMMFLSLATNISLYPIVLLPSLLVCSACSNGGSLKKSMVSLSIFIAASVFLLVPVSLQLSKSSSSWDLLKRTHGSLLMFSHLYPNLGLYWYLFIEMFDQFRSFYTIFMQSHIFFWSLPIALRFANSVPLFSMIISFSTFLLLQPYPTLWDCGFFITLLGLLDERIIDNLSFLPFTIPSFIVSCVMAPVTWFLWIDQGSGNANFYYGISLLFNSSLLATLIDVVRSQLYTQVLLDNPKLKKSQIYQR